MADHLTKAERSWNMSRIRAQNTRPEMVVRSILHRLGFRFRLHDAKLPGKPDIVLAKHDAVVLVHGCFWHRHRGCKYCTTPSQNAPYWRVKFRENKRRDRQSAQKLRKLGWRRIVVWECELRNRERLIRRLLRALQTERETS